MYIPTVITKNRVRNTGFMSNYDVSLYYFEFLRFQLLITILHNLYGSMGLPDYTGTLIYTKIEREKIRYI